MSHAEEIQKMQEEGPWLAFYDLGGGQLENPTIIRAQNQLDDMADAADIHTDGNVCVRKIPLGHVLATPDLLEACKKALACAQNGDCNEAGYYLGEAIAKAESK